MLSSCHGLSGKNMWGFSRLTTNCALGHGRFLAGTNSDQKDDIHESVSQMMFQLQNVYDADKVNDSLISCRFQQKKKQSNSWLRIH